MKLSLVLTHPDGTVTRRIKSKEEDFFQEAACLLAVKVDDPLLKRDQFATD